MKQNMLATMDMLEIDKGIRDLVRQLWKHCYRTISSCEGHGSEAYIMVTGGDEWFENKALCYGLRKYTPNSCCETQTGRCCNVCGAGLNKNSVYRGMLIQNHFKPDNYN
ncbi:MAG: hypothetical protein Q8R37_02730 [Nanoarchaeota archaeon]|nr:hypothetical protein [Nanoarchaeota archaeon]